jgi:uncharacterized protein YndB with AHSA1/START domain
MTDISGTTTGEALEITVELSALPERVFRALTREVTDWWVRPGVFDTREWAADPRPGGRWRAAGISRGQPYVATGEILELDSPRRFVHQWDGVGKPDAPSTLTYTLEPLPNGTRLTLRQTGFASPIACREFAAGWETSFARLAQILSSELSEVAV